jgi:hypothetical protein
MEWFALAVGMASLAAWDYGRRVAAQELEAVKIAADAASVAHAARTEVALVLLRADNNASVLTEHAIKLSAMDKRQTLTAQKLSITSENSRSVRKSPGRLTGVR